ncbi:MAG: methyltransferase [Polyangiales bacterium]
MNRPDSPFLEKPRLTDERLRDITAALMGFPVILVAHEMRLFDLLAGGAQTAEEVARALKLRVRAAETILDVATSAHFLTRDASRYALTPLAEDYLLSSSPTYWGHYLDYISQRDLYSLKNIREALTAPDRKHGKGTEIFDVHEEDAEQGRQFARWMHSVSMGPALSWPDHIDLGSHKHLLDIAGGSGAHTIGVLTRWPALRSTVLDRPSVLGVTRAMLSDRGLDERAQTRAFDIWRDPFPSADVHFYSQIFHDWSVDRCEMLAAKSFAALPSNGRIVLHELLPNQDGTGPFRVVAVNVVLCLLYSGGKQYTVRELSDLLKAAGFVDVVSKMTFNDWGIVTARKP